jgi:hypothetical protein
VNARVFELSPGDQLAGYRIERVLGHGGMGVVYEAVQMSLERSVALKVIAPEYSHDRAYRERFKREARLAAALEHPGVLPVYEHGATEDGLLYLSMRLTRGVDLREYLSDRGRLAPEEAVRILMPVAEALDAAHAAGMVHRDVKPGNILLEEAGGQRRVYLSDFGLAKRMEPDIGDATTVGQLVGTPHYMAPEQIAGGPVDGRADIYALGCLLYRVLVGQAPFERPNVQATLFAHLNDPPPMPTAARPGLAPVFDMVVTRALEKDPERRARSAGALLRRAAQDLESAPAGPPRSEPATLPLSAPAAPMAPAARRRGAYLPALTILAAVGIAVAAILFAGSQGGSADPDANDVTALRIGSETVRVAGQTGALVQRMAGADDVGGIEASSANLEQVAGSWRALSARTRASLPATNDAAAERLARAQRLGGQSARGLLSVARDPLGADGASLVQTAGRRYTAMLDRLRSATRLIQRRLDAQGGLSADDRALLETIGADLAAGRTSAQARFEALGNVVADLSGG